jgi:hypothetical protein
VSTRDARGQRVPQLNMRLSLDLRIKLQAAAAARGVTMSGLLRAILSDWLIANQSKVSHLKAPLPIVQSADVRAAAFWDDPFRKTPVA